MKESETPPSEAIPTWVSQISPQLRVMTTPHVALQLSSFQRKEHLRFSLKKQPWASYSVPVSLSIK